MGHTQIKCKCGHCGLHFLFCSWEPERRLATQIYCPECGKTGRLLLWREESTRQIFEVVPGPAEIIGMIGNWPLPEETQT